MKYQYELICTRYGGEHTIGSIPNEVAQFWSERCDGDNSKFEEYMFNWDDDDKNDGIPEKYQLREGYEHSDVMHEYTVEFAEGQMIDVEDTKNEKTIAEIKLTDVLVDKTTCPESDFRDKQNPHEEGTDESDYWEQPYALLFWAYNEKGWWGWLLETDEVFDATKLKVDIQLWSSLKLVSGFSYDGKELDRLDNTGDGNDSKGLYTWID